MCFLHCPFAVGDDDEMGVITELAQVLAESLHIGFIEAASTSSRMQNGTGLYLQYGEQQGNGRVSARSPPDINPRF